MYKSGSGNINVHRIHTCITVSSIEKKGINSPYYQLINTLDDKTEFLLYTLYMPYTLYTLCTLYAPIHCTMCTIWCIV